MHDTYTLLRHIADSWVLLAMTGFFVGCCLWAFRPGSRALHDEAAGAVFRAEAAPVLACDRGCAGCACTRIGEERK